jgi:hypothetical protein
MTKLSTKLKEEFFALLPPTIYFFLALHIVAFVRVLMLEKTGIAPCSSISIAVAALILGKAVLIADMLPLNQSFSAQTADLQHRLEDRYLLVAFCCDSLSETPDRFLARDGRLCRRQSKVAVGNHLAAFLGHPDHSLCSHRRVLHGARTGARDRERKGPADILRADACAASVMACFRTREKYSVKETFGV